MKAVVLLSGGMDSTTALAQALVDGAEKILAVSVKYGSKHNAAEGQSAKAVVSYYASLGVDIEQVTFELPSEIFKGEGSALLGEIDMPALTYKEIQESEGPSPTVVPFRNANLLSIAAALADARGYDMVYIGAHAEDAHNWAYPDCTPEFLGAMANAIYIGTYQRVRLAFPFIWMTKSDIVQRATELLAPLGLTWSCYSPVWVDARIGETDVEEAHFEHCGKCPTCVERANAFASLGYRDPVTYAIPLGDIVDGDQLTVDALTEWFGI